MRARFLASAFCLLVEAAVDFTSGCIENSLTHGSLQQKTKNLRGECADAAT
jgi:hypothetical protein